MRVLAATISVIFAAACANDGSKEIQNSSGHHNDAGDPDACGTSDASIVFAAMLDGQSATDLYVVTAHGMKPMRLTNTPGAELFPAWSPDHTRVAFVRDGKLYVLDVASGTERLVAERFGRPTRELSAAAWSPDGTRLVYPYPRDPFIIVRDPPEGPIDESYATTLHFVNADGTNDVAFDESAIPSPSNPPGIGTVSDPAWSSTNLLAFTVADDCPDCAGGSRYSVSSVDGTGFFDIEPADLAEPFVPRHGLDWSPDGMRWVYTADAFSPKESPGVIATRAVATNDARGLTDPGAWYPRYAPDGASIAFLREDGIWVMSPSGTGQHRILSATGVRGLDW